jgi:hypothetical protein
MAILTVTNLTSGSLFVPAPVSRTLAGYKSAQVQANLTALGDLSSLVKAGLLQVRVQEDASIPDALEPLETMLKAQGDVRVLSFTTLSDLPEHVYKVPIYLEPGQAALVEAQGVYSDGVDIMGAHKSRGFVFRSATDGSYYPGTADEYFSAGSGRVNVEAGGNEAQVVFEGLPFAVPPVPPSGSITFLGGAAISQGDTVVLSDGDSVVTFVFDHNGSVVETETTKPVSVPALSTDEDYAIAFAAAVNAAEGAGDIELTADRVGAEVALLGSPITGAVGNVPIVLSFTPTAVSGMSGGVDGVLGTAITWNAVVSVHKS